MNIKNLLDRLKESNIRIQCIGDRLKIAAPKGTLTNDLINAVNENRDQIIQILQYIDKKKTYASIQPGEKKEYYVLSSAQKRLYFLQQLYLKSTTYNMFFFLPMGKDIEKDRLESTLRKLLTRHESLRTSFIPVNEIPVQRIHDNVVFEIEYFDLATENRGQTIEGKPDTLLSSFICQLSAGFIRPFDLSQAPLVRSGLIKLPDGHHTWIIDMHHIISDGTSQMILAKDFISLQNGENLEPLPVQYKDFSQWQNRLFESAEIGAQEKYWLELYSDAGEIPRLDLPIDFKRPEVFTFEGDRCGLTLAREDAVKFKALGTGNDGTLFTNFLAALDTLFYKYTGQEDIIIGASIAGRLHADLQQIVGMFINTLPMRNYPRGEKTYEAFLKEVIARSVKAFENQDVQFETLVEKLEVERDPARNPIFDIDMVVQNFRKVSDNQLTKEKEISSQASRVEQLPLTGETLPQIEYNKPTAKFDMTFFIHDRGETIHIIIEYYTGIFKQETIRRLASHFENIVKIVAKEPSIKLKDIEMISEAEKNQLLYEWNDTTALYTEDKTLHELFAEQVEKTPDHTALIRRNTKSEIRNPKQIQMTEIQNSKPEGTGGLAPLLGPISLTYKELNEKSNQLAHLLMERGIAPDIIVGIMIERSVEMLIGILGILKAGGAYLPIDPEYPEERINYMLTDSKVNILVKNSNIIRGFGSEQELFVLNFEHLNFEFVSNFEFRISDLDSSNLAYIIYTSGTTGPPKGVMIDHQSLVNYVQWGAKQYIDDLADHYHFPLYTSISFDLTITSIFMPLVCGHTIVMYDNDQPQLAILEVFKTGSTDIVKATPSHLKLLQAKVNLENSGVKCFIVGGEAFASDLAGDIYNSFPGGIEIYNEYGPTEATVGCMIYRYNGEGGKSEREVVPIGVPVDNVKIYLLDRDFCPVPINAAGEIYIGGHALARGYLNQPELTAEKFLSFFYRSYKSYTSYIPGRIYRTGDLARWLPEGNMEFLGRIDNQVKIRGYRIELQEIENRLLHHEEIKEAVVIDRETEDGDKYLCAYLVAQRKAQGAGCVNQSPGTAVLRDYLSQLLPAYMIPSYFVPLARIPLTPNGKPDRNALPVPGVMVGNEYTAPGDEIEKQLVKIWSEMLGIAREELSTDANFFQLGGHSLKATLLTSRVHEKLDVKLPLTEVFKTPTIKGQARYIKRAAKNKYTSLEPVEKKEYYTLSSAQQRLYILQQMDETNTGYNMPLILPLGKEIERDKLEFTIKKLIVRHESLRTSFITVNEIPVQRIHDHVDFQMTGALTHSDRYRCGGSDQEGTRGLAPLLKNFIRPFDLSQAPLVRSGLIKHPDGNHTWIVDMHHIISDGTSHMILTEDFISLYYGEELKPLGIQYKDFSQWQNRLLANGEIEAQEKYWLELYADAAVVPRLDLPADFKRPEVFTFTGDRYSFVLEKQQADQFKALATRNNGTLYMNLLTALDTLFYKYTGQTDMIIGTGIAARRHINLQEIIGMFVNTLAMRNTPAGEKTYEYFLKEVINNSVKAFENQDVQFEDLVDQLQLARDASRNPLFDITMVVQNFQKPGQQRQQEAYTHNSHLVTILPLAEENLNYVSYNNPTSKFDLTFFVHEKEDEIFINIEYYTAIFKRETIVRLVRHFRKLINEVLANPLIKLENIDILSAQEKQHLLVQLNDTAVGYPKEKTICQLFEEQVRQTPDAAALVFENSILSYKGLDEKSNHLANYLIAEQDIKPDVPVGIMLEKSLELVTAILGVLKAGRTYLPLDATMPENRIKLIINDSCLSMVISVKKLIRILNKLQWECQSFRLFLCVDSIDIYGEAEAEQGGLMDPKLWDYLAESAVDEITWGGWLTSYSGEPFTEDEMDQYGDNALKKLTPLLHPRMRMLEIGCASGITMYRLAPNVGYYLGTDLSPITIEKNKQQIKQQGYQNISLACLAAHEIDKIAERNFDLVIINSVIQSFPGHNYLRKVISKAIDLLAHQGYLFIGDIMDQDLKDSLIREMMEFKYSRAGSSKTKTDWSAELFVSRAFFQDLLIELPAISTVEFSNKIYTIENELTKFRYDTLMKIDKTKKQAPLAQEKQKHQHDRRVLEKFQFQGTPRELEKTVNPGHLAYMIYTSGSTGQPKGVPVAHQNVVRLVKDTNFIEFAPGDRLLLTGAIAFDITTFELWGPLLNGLSLYLVTRERLLDIQRLEIEVVKNNISILHLIPQLFSQVLSECPGVFAGLKYFLVGGDLVRPESVNRLRDQYPGLKILHMYGPTENTTFSTYFPVDKDYHQSIPIGKPINHSVVYIISNDGQLQPIGVPGELCTGGDGVTRGYLNNPELTAEKFNYLPSFLEGTRGLAPLLYHTGDLARWLAAGNIEFLGRIDHQVKIRGFRIELQEIENRLLNHKEIKEAVVIDRDTEDSDKYLCAYYVAKRTAHSAEQENPRRNVTSFETLTDNTLREYLAKNLPEYMIPSYFVSLEQIPLTPNGKIDYRALPVPDLKTTQGYIAPRNTIEKKLARIWSQVLGNERDLISIDDNFFQLGGHSLKATILTSRVHKQLDVKLPLAEVFKTPTIRELAGYIKSAGKEVYASLQVVEEKEYYPLSSAQKRIYILQQMDETSTGYNIPFFLELEGEVDESKLEDTFNRLIQRHESFRTSFIMLEKQLVQVIHQEVVFAIEHQPGFCKVNMGLKPFDLSRAPLLRVLISKIKEKKYILMLDVHHIISDGISINIIAREFGELYEGKQMSRLRFRYKDFSQWQNNIIGTVEMKQLEEFWLNQFEGEIPVLDLPIDYKRPLLQRFEGSNVHFEINEQQTRQLKQLWLSMDTTPFMVLLAAFNLLLAKLTGQEDIVIGTPAAGRHHGDLENIIGMFINTLALRNYPLAETTVIDFLKEVKENTLNAFENQDYQYEDLVEAVVKKRDLSRNPLFDVMFAFQNIGSEPLSLPRLKITPSPHQRNLSKFDMSFGASEVGNTLFFIVEYCTKLFKKQTIERYINYFKHTLSSLLENPGKRLKEIELIPVEEKSRILNVFNDTTVEFPADKTVHELFADQAKRSPDSTAVVARVPGNKKNGVSVQFIASVTYKELNQKSQQLAWILRTKGVKPGSIVALMVERSIEMVIGMISILKAGGAYLPIDPLYPEERILFILKECSTKILLAAPGLSGKLKKSSIINCQLLMVNEKTPFRRRLNNPPKEANLINNYQLTINNLQLENASLAYIIYTSGSTGQPKGVLIEHRSVVNVITSFNRTYQLSRTDRVLQQTSISFDVSVNEIFPVLCKGGALVLAIQACYFDLEALVRMIYIEHITIISASPSLLSRLNSMISELPGLRLILSGGEALTFDHVRRLTQFAAVVNGYGPTEATICSSSYHLGPADPMHPAHSTHLTASTGSNSALTGTIPIGKPIMNYRLYILDNHLSVVPIGVKGELFIAGVGLARGYLNNPELTAEKFCLRRARCFTGRFLKKLPRETSGTRETSAKNFLLKGTVIHDNELSPGDDENSHRESPYSPYSPHSPHSPIYRTGDLARWLPDGNVEFLGRIDQQVKIRGFRIELQEIENRLLKYEMIKEAKVIDWEMENQDKYLCAYFVSVLAGKERQEPGENEVLREYLSQSLPQYMIPRYFIPLEEIPLTTSGKVDRSALPRPSLAAGAVARYVPPGNELERELVEIWSDVLGIEKESFGIEHGFFELGGHSLTATMMASKIHEQLDIKVPLVKIFEAAHIRGLAQFITHAAKDQFIPIKPVEKKEYYPLSYNQKRLWILHSVNPNSTSYHMTGVIHFDHAISTAAVKKTLARIVARHESLRTGFKEVYNGPVQFIPDNVDIPFRVLDISTLTEDKKRQKTSEMMTRMTQPFDLKTPPLFRSVLINQDENAFVFVFNMHHIISDGWSMELLKEEFSQLLGFYSKGIKGNEPAFAAQQLQYKDFVHWHNRQLRDPVNKDKAHDYWKKIIEPGFPPLELPYSVNGNPEDKVGTGYRCVVTEDIKNRLRALAKGNYTTLFTVLFTLYNLLLAHCSGEKEIAVNIISAGRQHSSLHTIVGYFINPVIVKTIVDLEGDFTDLLSRVHKDVLEAFEHQDYPFELVLADLGAAPARISTAFNLLNIQDISTGTKLDSLDSYHIEKEQEVKFEISLYVTEYKNGIEILWEYQKTLFKPETIKELAENYLQLMDEITRIEYHQDEYE